MLRNKNNEYDDLRTKYSRMEGDQRKIGELENALNEQHVIFIFNVLETNYTIC